MGWHVRMGEERLGGHLWSPPPMYSKSVSPFHSFGTRRWPMISVFVLFYLFVFHLLAFQQQRKL